MKKYFVIIIGIFVIIIFKNFILKNDSEKLELERPDYDMESEIVDLNVIIDNERVPISLEIAPVELSMQDAFELFGNVREKINLEISENYEPLELVTQMDGVDILWLSSDEKIISNEGIINPYELNVDEEKIVVLTAIFSVADYRCEYEFELLVKCPPLNSYDRKIQWINTRIKKYLDENSDTKQIELPELIDGIDVRYEFQPSNNMIFILIIPLGIVAFFLGKKADENNREKAKNRQLEIDYCEVVSKIVLLMGAGLTIRGAWEKMVADYKAQKKSGRQRLVYEEMAVTLNELAAGVPERLVYENFGKRCKLPRYIKLGSLLQQNFIKGSKQLLNLLENESDAAFEERKLLAKKQGEEAGTKLLIPMALELVVVMIIVMAPALMSF